MGGGGYFEKQKNWGVYLGKGINGGVYLNKENMWGVYLREEKNGGVHTVAAQGCGIMSTPLRVFLAPSLTIQYLYY